MLELCKEENPKMPLNDRVLGHRKRLRERFIKSGLKGFHDYEVIELLLSLGTPRNRDSYKDYLPSREGR